jgi:hypothetical protein
MNKFMLIYRGGDDAEANMTPQEMQAVLQKWNDWIGGGFAAGWMVDPGNPLGPGGKMVSPKGVVTDGPYPEGKEIVGGYSIVQCETIEQAAEHAKGCPIKLYNGLVEVRPVIDIAPKA